MSDELQSKQKPTAKLPDAIEQLRGQLKESENARTENEKKAAEYLDKLQRLQAEMENLQKITKRQFEALTRQASENVMVKLLPILDSLEQAGRIAQSNNKLPLEEVAMGLKMLQNQLMDVLRTEGLEEIEAMGQLLDPKRHEVINYVESDVAAENTVVEEVRKGYILNGKVIRPTMVVVTKPKPGEKATRDSTEQP